MYNRNCPPPGGCFVPRNSSTEIGGYGEFHGFAELWNLWVFSNGTSNLRVLLRNRPPNCSTTGMHMGLSHSQRNVFAYNIIPDVKHMSRMPAVNQQIGHIFWKLCSFILKQQGHLERVSGTRRGSVIVCELDNLWYNSRVIFVGTYLLLSIWL